MNPEDFRKCGRDMVDYIANYMENVVDKTPIPDVPRGYLTDLVPKEAPEEGEKWEDVLKDLDRVIMPGVTHWQSNHFHAFFPSGNSFPSILGDMLSDAIGCIAFSWSANPASTELEVLVMNWLAKVLQLPQDFVFRQGGLGGGAIQGTTSEATFLCMVAARSSTFQRIQSKRLDVTKGQIIDKLVAYTSEEVHCSMDKAAMFSAITMRTLPTDENGSLRGPALEKAILEDKAKGLIPFFVCATIGTTASCAFDNLEELGPVCNENDIWLHVDAAYAGSACICPEFRPLLNGVEHCMSLSFNPHKWLRVNFDCSVMWLKNRFLMSDAFQFRPEYLDFPEENTFLPDFAHLQLQSGRRFRSIKLWLVIRMFGIKGLQEYIRKDVALAKQFEGHVRGDERFEIVRHVTMSLVVFRLKGDNTTNEALFRSIRDDRRIYLSEIKIKDTSCIRFVIGAATTTSSDVTYAWNVIQELTTLLLNKHKVANE